MSENQNQHLFDKIIGHVNHKIEVVHYGPPDNPANASVECMTCNAVICDAGPGWPEPAEKRFRVIFNMGDSISIMPSTINPGYVMNDVLAYLNEGAKLSHLSMYQVKRDMGFAENVGDILISEKGKLPTGTVSVAVVRVQ